MSGCSLFVVSTQRSGDGFARQMRQCVRTGVEWHKKAVSVCRWDGESQHYAPVKSIKNKSPHAEYRMATPLNGLSLPFSFNKKQIAATTRKKSNNSPPACVCISFFFNAFKLHRPTGASIRWCWWRGVGGGGAGEFMGYHISKFPVRPFR